MLLVRVGWIDIHIFACDLAQGDFLNFMNHRNLALYLGRSAVRRLTGFAVVGIQR